MSERKFFVLVVVLTSFILEGLYWLFLGVFDIKWIVDVCILVSMCAWLMPDND